MRSRRSRSTRTDSLGLAFFGLELEVGDGDVVV